MIVVLLCAALVIVAGLLLPVIQVFRTRTGPITTTRLMCRRLREAREEGRTDFLIDVRWVGLDQISCELVKAVIAVEDCNFLSHHGFSPDGLRLALGELLRTGHVTYGYSTITNQTARNVFLTIRKHYWRKALEFYYSILIEFIWGKRRIMEVYLNVIEMGDGIFGGEAAARGHFGKRAATLTLHESVLLAVSLRNPRRFSPKLFVSGIDWWTDVIDTCEWMVSQWNPPDDESFWNLCGNKRNCGQVITVAARIASRLKKIARDRKTVYRRGAIGSPADDGRLAFGSSGLIKNDLWDWKGQGHRNGGDAYGATCVPDDMGANTMIGMCRNVSSDFSKIQVGELVWIEGHVGLYVGDGLAVESTPLWKNGVQLTACKCDREGYPRRDWTKHGKFPFIGYARPILKAR